MDLVTNLRGRLKNTSLSVNNALLPVFESVSNAIHAIEDAGLPMGQGKVVVEILRKGQFSLGYAEDQDRRANDPITAFTIKDNGIGFTPENMESFRTLDTQFKAERGGRGVGRLLWLKAFSRASIRSAFVDKHGVRVVREFNFDVKNGIDNDKIHHADGKDTGTLVKLDSFSENYRKNAPKTTKVIANSLLAHCLWYFVRPGGAPHIVIVDEDERIRLDEIYEHHMMTSASSEVISIKDNRFELIHIKLAGSSNWDHSIAYCAANRMVREENIKGRIPGLFGNLEDEKGDFVYQCYVSSPLLDDRVRSERTGFDIEEEPSPLYERSEISFFEIRNTVLERAKNFLSPYLEHNKQLGKQRVEAFVTRKAPRYRPILARIPEDELAVDPDIQDKDLDLVLHKHLVQLEREVLEEGHNVMAPDIDEDFYEYSARLKEYLAKVEEIKRSDLANYVSHRKVVIDLLEMAIQRKEDGSYAREDLVHGLIMPMRTDSAVGSFDNRNLWLIDERLAFHDYLASDKRLDSTPVTGSSDAKKPDIFGLRTFDNPILTAESTRLPPASLVVIELKRPMRNDARQGEDKDPIEQSLGYLERIRQGKVTTVKGRLIPGSESIPGFCYVICDLTPTIEKRCKIHDAIRTSDGLGYFFYNKSYSTYVRVMSYDQVLNSAKERNKAFFDQLGFPTN